MYYLGCMVVNINALFAELSITERDYFQILLLGILASMLESTLCFLDRNAVTATFQVLVNKYFLNFSLALLWFCLLIVLRALSLLI